MQPSFDEEIARRGTNSVKWEFMPGGPGEALSSLPAGFWAKTAPCRCG
jgi:hypothetical protein